MGKEASEPKIDLDNKDNINHSVDSYSVQMIKCDSENPSVRKVKTAPSPEAGF